MTKILVLSLDYDDCLVRKSDSNGKPRTGEEGFDAISDDEFDVIINRHKPPENKTRWKKRLAHDNAQMLAYVSSIADQYDEIIICCGSNRQNPYIDTTNSCRNNLYSGSCYEGLEIFQNILQGRVSVPVTLDRTVTADFFHRRPPGRTFSCTLAWLRGKEVEEKNFFEECPNDRTKVSLHYSYMHKIAGEQHNAQIDYYAIDDNYQGELKQPNPAIIDALNDVYLNNPGIIPVNTTLFTLPYQHGTPNLGAMYKVQGTGIIDARYDETMQEMMVCSIDEDDDVQRKTALFSYNNCSCWDVFSNPQKKTRFLSTLQTRRPEVLPIQSTLAFTSSLTHKNVLIEEFIEKHCSSYRGYFCGFFSRTNLVDRDKYHTLTGAAILEHAKQKTFLGFKNRTCTILEEMEVIDNNGQLLKPAFGQ